MVPNSEINEVHTAHLGDKYPGVAVYLQDPEPNRRRSYEEYVDRFSENPVYELNADEEAITFQSECLLPQNDRGRPKVLLLFSNAHPESIKNGMFHTAEGGIAALWTDLCCAGLFSGDCRVIASPDELRNHCLNIGYDGPFALGFACYWLFPTFDPSHLKALFGRAMEPPGFDHPKRRIDRLLGEWQPKAVISFNKKVFEEFAGARTTGNIIERLRADLVRYNYRVRELAVPIFATYPAGWRFDPNATRLRQDSLRRIADAIRSDPSG
ncbi:MAG: hypothetical protein O6837_03220 [Deltaproteobacteria bacterium]|nr:hypothetical protein [Deltaproteobacteria bacterium]MCZ6563347.1 hypothetical protein [Deltaproteobacteria bacterium]